MNEKVFDLLVRAQQAEDSKDLDERSRLAKKILKSHPRIDVSGAVVSTVWDRQSRNYITMTTDANGYEVADAQYTGRVNDAAVAHFWAIQEALRGNIKDNPPKTTLQDLAERAWKAYQRSGSRQCDSIVCTSSAEWLRDKYFKKANIVGYFSEDNSSALVGKDEGGHDFLLVDGRYIIDFWYRDLYDQDADLILDAEASPDRVRKLYGDARKWSVV